MAYKFLTQYDALRFTPNALVTSAFGVPAHHNQHHPALVGPPRMAADIRERRALLLRAKQHTDKRA